jgi:ABC-type amino acid transport/signal transduction systems, periplasmic component/domain
MGFTDDNQNIIGFDIDVAKEVCKRMGVELVLQPISWEAKEVELSTKNIDCIWNGLSYNEDRAKAMTLSIPYMKNHQVAVVLADSNINSLADLAGKKVVIQNGSTASDAMDANADFKNSLKELIKVNDNVQALLDLKTSGSDAVVLDEVVARYYTEKEPGTYKVLDESLSDEDYVIGFRKGDVTLCSEVEKYLREMASDSTLANISKTWFGKDLTTVK